MQALLIEDDFVSSAALFTARRYALAGHLHRHNGESFIHHPRELAKLLSGFPHNRDVLAAAWLSRPLQEAYADAEEIEDCFGKKTAELASKLAAFNLPDSCSLPALAKVEFAAIRNAGPVLQTMALAHLFVLANTTAEYSPEMLAPFAKWLRLHIHTFNQANTRLIEKVSSWLLETEQQEFVLEDAG